MQLPSNWWHPIVHCSGSHQFACENYSQILQCSAVVYGTENLLFSNAASHNVGRLSASAQLVHCWKSHFAGHSGVRCCWSGHLVTQTFQYNFYVKSYRGACIPAHLKNIQDPCIIDYWGFLWQVSNVVVECSNMDPVLEGCLISTLLSMRCFYSTNDIWYYGLFELKAACPRRVSYTIQAVTAGKCRLHGVCTTD